jgi:hypothetical protein
LQEHGRESLAGIAGVACTLKKEKKYVVLQEVVVLSLKNCYKVWFNCMQVAPFREWGVAYFLFTSARLLCGSKL